MYFVGTAVGKSVLLELGPAPSPYHPHAAAFGLDGGREHTLEEIGGMLGVTRERVRQLRDRALRRLREGDTGKALASFAA